MVGAFPLCRTCHSFVVVLFYFVLFCFSPCVCLTLSVIVCTDRLVGLVLKPSASRAEDPGFESRMRRDFSGLVA